MDEVMNSKMEIEMAITKLTAKQMPNGVYKVAYNGHVLGDDRGFISERLCFQEIRKRLEKDAREAVIYNRELLYSADLLSLGAGYEQPR